MNIISIITLMCAFLFILIATILFSTSSGITLGMSSSSTSETQNTNKLSIAGGLFVGCGSILIIIAFILFAVKK